MRTSMRPRSAGSSRISKLLLPLLTEAAISTASPLSGTGAFVAAVAVSVAADVVVGVASCGWIMPAVGTPVSELAGGGRWRDSAGGGFGGDGIARRVCGSRFARAGGLHQAVLGRRCR